MTRRYSTTETRNLIISRKAQRPISHIKGPKTLGVSRSGYYRRKKRASSDCKAICPLKRRPKAFLKSLKLNYQQKRKIRVISKFVESYLKISKYGIIGSSYILRWITEHRPRYNSF